MTTAAARLSRVVLAAPFVWLGWEAFSAPGPRIQLAQDFGVPQDLAPTAVKANGAAMVAGGLAVATGILPRIAAVGLIASMVPTTLAGHSFWNDSDPMAAKMNRIHFLKNVGLIGGLIGVAATRRSHVSREA